MNEADQTFTSLLIGSHLFVVMVAVAVLVYHVTLVSEPMNSKSHETAGSGRFVNCAGNGVERGSTLGAFAETE